MKDASLYPKWYGFEHTAPALLKEAVYGLTDLFADKVRGRRLVANPAATPLRSSCPWRHFMRPESSAMTRLWSQTESPAFPVRAGIRSRRPISAR
jgi:hypothetical protein